MKKLGHLAIVVIMTCASSVWAQGADAEAEVKADEGESASAAEPAAEQTEEKPATETEAPVEEAKAEEAKVEEAKVEEAKVEEAKPEEAKVEEVKALETDIEEAKAKVEALKADTAPAGFEEIKAQPTETETGIEGSVELAADEETEDDKPFGAMVVLDHSFGTGNFVKDANVRRQSDYIAQSWDIRPSYSFPLFGHKLKVMARFLFEIEYTKPDTNPSRRFKPIDSSIYLSDSEIYKEPFTEIAFNAGTRIFFPTSYESINVTKRWTAMTVYGGASRSIGPVDLSYGLSVSKYFNGSKIAVGRNTVARSSDATYGNVTGTGDPHQIAAGYANTSFAIVNSVSVGYNFTENLALGYSLLFWNTFRYNIADDLGCSTEDNPYLDCERGRSDNLWPSLEVSYKLDDLLKEVYPLPFGLTAAGGITALHPALTADNKNIIWPVFWQAFASNRAANNYGSIYFDLVGTY